MLFAQASEFLQGWSISSIVIPVMILLIAIAFVVTVKAVASRYKKVPPNQVLVVYGAKSAGKGFRIVSGGGALVWPIIEDWQMMSTEAFQVLVDEKSIPNKDNVMINVRGVATCKINTTDDALHNAAQSFLGKSEEEIAGFVKNILLGHLRSIIGKLDISEILRNRDMFNKQVVAESTEELQRLGVQVVTMVIQEVTDGHGYIEALGKQAVAEAIRNADIKVAEAKAETTKQVSNANRDAEITVAQNAVKVAEANKNRDVQSAQFKVLADNEKAKADQALAIATAAQEQTLKVAQAQRDAAEREAQIEVSRQEALRREQELQATVVKQAEADKQTKIIAAEAAQNVKVIEAEAEAKSAIARAEGSKQAKTLEGQGEAAKMTAEAEGQAALKRQVLVAEAEGQAAMKGKVLLAEAEGQAAMKGKVLLAEAEGTAKLAEALAKMTDSAKLILILDRLPALMDRGGDAAAKVAQAVFASVAAPFGNIQELRIVDVGGNGRGLDQIGSVVPTTVFKFLAAMQNEGVNLVPLLAKLGINIDETMKMVSPAAGAKPAEPTEPASTAK